MAPPRWQIVYTDYAGTAYGEVLDAHDRQFNFNLLAPNNLSFRLPLVASQAANLLTNKEGLLLAYRNRTLKMTAELTSLEVKGGGDGEHDFAVTAVETMHTRLMKRLLGKSTSGLSGPTNETDQGLWLQQQLDALNGVNSTGLRIVNPQPSGNISGGTWRYKPFMELMQELSASVGGYDFYQLPRNPALTAGVTGDIIIKPVVGTTRPNVVFEYGTGAANAREYQWLVHNESIINLAYALPPSYPDDAGLKVASSQNAGSQATRGLREEVVPTDLNNLALRNQLCQLHILLRANPREQFLIQPQVSDGSGRVPQFLDAYGPGDMIRGRVRDQNILMLDAMVRVYGGQVDVDDEGQENVTLTLINDGAATDSGSGA